MNPINKIQKWMDTMAGQTFMQYAYSWGAAIVILGTLFKLTHIAGANAMLFIGMGTEVFVFFIAGFERVTEKAKQQDTEAEIPQQQVIVAGGAVAAQAADAEVAIPSGPIIIGGGAPVAAASAAPVAGTESLVQATDPSTVEEAVKNYAEQLTELTEVLGRVKIQANRMSTDSEEMENLNRTLTGIATVYELQLRNISKQVSTIEQIDEQTRHMADQIQELNNVYARMIQALTVNMGTAPVAQNQ